MENKLHELVCDGTMTLSSVQRQIAANWLALYRKVFGVAPNTMDRAGRRPLPERRRGKERAITAAGAATTRSG